MRATNKIQFILKSYIRIALMLFLHMYILAHVVPLNLHPINLKEEAREKKAHICEGGRKKAKSEVRIRKEMRAMAGNVKGKGSWLKYRQVWAAGATYVVKWLAGCQVAARPVIPFLKALPC